MRGKNAESIVKRLIRDAAFLSKPLSQLTPAMVRDWRDARVKQVRPASVRRELNAMSSIFTSACLRRLNFDPPCRFNIDPGRIIAF